MSIHDGGTNAVYKWLPRVADVKMTSACSGGMVGLSWS